MIRLSKKVALLAGLVVFMTTLSPLAAAKEGTPKNDPASPKYTWVDQKPVDIVAQYQLIRSGQYKRNDNEIIGSRSEFTVHIEKTGGGTNPNLAQISSGQTIVCQASAGVGEVVYNGDPNAVAEILLEACSSPDVTGQGYLYLERFDRTTNAWQTLASKYSAISIGIPVRLYYRHDGAKVDSDYRARVSYDLTCSGCTPGPLVGESPSERLGKFFSSWSVFDQHYVKHAVTQNEWLPRPSKMEYLDMARTATGYAALVAGGMLDSTYRAAINNGNLYGWDMNSNDIIIANAWYSTYPYIGTHYKWMAQYDPYKCPSASDHYTRISTNSKVGTNCLY